MKLPKLLFTALFITCANLNSVDAQIAPKAEDVSPLLIGETLPKSDLKDPNGNKVKLSDIIAKKPTVLVFYRGRWCPYCNAQLSGLGLIESDILKLGYQIVAISPDDVKNLKQIISDDSIKYSVYSDSAGKLIQEVGIAYQTPGPVKGFIASKTKGTVTEVLPVPTVMVINTKGEILFEYINPNYKERISPEMLLAVLQSLNAS